DLRLAQLREMRGDGIAPLVECYVARHDCSPSVLTPCLLLGYGDRFTSPSLPCPQSLRKNLPRKRLSRGSSSGAARKWPGPGKSPTASGSNSPASSQGHRC